MNRPVIIRPAAQADLADAKQWYEIQRRGLGRIFLSDARQTLSDLKFSAEAFPIIEDDVRIALFRRFPYVAAFQISPRQVTVIAIYHAHREPRQWSER